jgi:hypothetical protein
LTASPLTCGYTAATVSNMALIHSIAVATGTGSTHTETRTSENRRYTACLIITTTEATVRVNAARRAAAEVSLAAWRETLGARRKLHNGMTVEQAKAWTKDVTTKWYGRDNATGEKVGDYNYWNALDQARPEVGDLHHSDRAAKRAYEIMVKRGFSDPYDYVKNPSGIVEAADKVDALVRTLKDWKVPTVGAQGVASWHGSVALAQKAIGGLDYVRVNGDSIEIRTDIAIREQAKRAAKAVAS